MIDTITRTFKLVEAIARKLELIPPLPTSKPAMATKTFTIGSGEDYSTITSWEADLDNGVLYTAGDDAVGEVVAGTYVENPTINGGGTINLNSVRLTGSTKHNGIAGAGAVIQGSVVFSVPDGMNQNYVIEDIEIDGNGGAGPGIDCNGSSFQDVGIIRRMIVHSFSGGNSYFGLIKCDARDMVIANCILYDNTRDTSLDTRGIYADCDRTEGAIVNNVVDNIVNGGTGSSVGIEATTNSTNGKIKNNIVTNCDTGYSFPGTNIDSLNNISEDATADDAGGTGHLINQTFGDINFVSTVAGSEDYHIESGSIAEDAGVDLGASGIPEVSLDINGNDRTTATTWDIGAHELELSAGGGGTSVTPTGIHSVASSFNPTTVLGSLIISGLLSQTISRTIDPSISFGGLNITASPIVSVASSVDPSVELGSLSLNPSNSSTVASSVDPNISFGELTITPSSVSSVSSIIDPITILGSLSLTPTEISVISSTVNPTVEDSGILIAVGNSSSVSSTFDPSVGLGSVAVTPISVSSIAFTVDPSVVLDSQAITPVSEALAVSAVVDPSVVLGSIQITVTASSIASTVDPSVQFTGGVIVSVGNSSAIASTFYVDVEPIIPIFNTYIGVNLVVSLKGVNDQTIVGTA